MSGVEVIREGMGAVTMSGVEVIGEGLGGGGRLLEHRPPGSRTVTEVGERQCGPFTYCAGYCHPQRCKVGGVERGGGGGGGGDWRCFGISTSSTSYYSCSTWKRSMYV